MILNVYERRVEETKLNITNLKKFIKTHNDALMRELEQNRLGGKKKRLGLKK